MKKLKKSKGPSKTTLANKCDKLWRTVGKENAVCEVCRTLQEGERVNYTQLHPHHFIGRINKRLRWDLYNRVWLCPIHHTFGNLSAHNDPEWFREWMKEYKYYQWVYCNDVKGDLVRNIDYEVIIKNLCEQLH